MKMKNLKKKVDDWEEAGAKERSSRSDDLNR
jgi:hypothetical protein